MCVCLVCVLSVCVCVCTDPWEGVCDELRGACGAVRPQRRLLHGLFRPRVLERRVQRTRQLLQRHSSADNGKEGEGKWREREEGDAEELLLAHISFVF